MENKIKTKVEDVSQSAAELERLNILVMIQNEMNTELQQFGGEPSQRFFHLEGIKKMIETNKHRAQ